MRPRPLIIFLALPLALSGQIGDSYADALRYFDLGRYDLAQNRLERLLERDRQCIECYELLAKIATSTENDTLAAEWFYRAVEVEPENSSLVMQLGLAYHRLGYLDSAITNIQESLRLDSTNAEGHFSIGNVWYDLDSLAEAEAGYATAVALDSTVAKYHFQLGEVYQQTERPDSALTEYAAAYGLYPKYSAAYESAASLLRQQGRWHEMVTVLESGLGQAAETGRTRYWLGSAYNEIGEYQRAAEILGGFVQRNDTHLGARFRYGLALYQIGEYGLTTEHLTLVSRALPNLLESRLYLGMAYNALDQDSAAFAVYDSLLLTNPDYYEGWVGRGDIHLKRRRYFEARQHFETATNLNIERWDAYHRLGLMHYEQMDYLAAEFLLFQALVREDSVFTIQLALGHVAAAVGEDDFASYYYGKVVADDPEDIAARTLLVESLTRRGLYRAARSVLAHFLEIDYEDREGLLYQLSRLSYAGGDPTAGDAYLDRYLSLRDPRRFEERYEKLIFTDPNNPKHHRQLGDHYLARGYERLARNSFRRAVSLGDSTLTATDYIEEATGR